MINDIKLKSGIIWNSMNNVVTEFIVEALDTRELMKHIVGIKRIKHTKIRSKLIPTNGNSHLAGE